MNQPRPHAQGFTLIELLIVIAIIGILAAVLIPNLLGARRRANDLVAKSYLSDAVKTQEINHIDEGAYTDPAGLRLIGLRGVPQDVELDILTPVVGAQSRITYCMAAGHHNGSGKIFYATPEKGIYESTASNAPTMSTTAGSTGATACP